MLTRYCCRWCWLVAVCPLLLTMMTTTPAVAAKPLLEAGRAVFANDNQAKRVYRLPGIIVTSKGTVIVVAQRRWGSGDFVPQDLVCRRSTDGGKTWGPEISIHLDPERQICMFNGCLVEDIATGKILLHFIEFPWSERDHWFKTVWLKRGGGHCQVESTDDGQTWSEPVLQMPVPNRDGWRGASSLNNNHGVRITQGPHKGRLGMNARVFMPGKTTWRGKGGIVYSDDHGQTWKIGGVPFPDRERYETESCLVETTGGGIYVNYRNEGRQHKQRLFQRSDGGETVSEQGIHEDLPAMVCNAGMTRYSWEPKSIILLSMPASARRRDLTCFASFDDGRTWPVRRTITTDGGYSDVAVLSDKTILVAYEPDGAREGIAPARFNLDWLMHGEGE